MIIKTDTLEPIIPSGDKWNIEFDIISRQLNINSLPTIVSGDNNSNIILIKTPLYYNDIDLSTINCVLRYKTDWRKEDGAINEGQIDLTTSITKFDDYIIYTWVLDQRQTLYRGNCIISLEYFMNLTEDPYQNQAKFYLTKISDENGDYLQIGKDELTTDIEKKYWSISSLPLTFSIGDGGNIAEGIEPDDNIADSGYDDGYAQGYEDGYNKGNMLYYVTTCNSLYGGAVFPENTEIVVKVKNVTNYGYMFSNVLNVKSIKMISDTQDTVVNVERLCYIAYDRDKTLEIVDFTEFNKKFSNLFNIFYNQFNLKTVLGAMDLTNCTDVKNAFSSCSALENIEFEKGTIKISISFANCSLLTDTSIQSIIDGLATVDTPQTLTVHQEVRNKLTDDQLDQIANKNWLISPQTSTT